MNKTNKRAETQIIKALTLVCDDSKYDCESFTWLTHEVNYARFPESLRVTLVFTEDTPQAVLLEGLARLVPRVQDALEPIIQMRLPAKQIEARYEID